MNAYSNIEMTTRDKKGRFKKVKIERELSKIIDRIGIAINEISLAKISSLYGDELSKKALHLATMKAFLGQSIADIEFTFNLMEADKKVKWNEIYQESRTNPDKLTVDDCKAIADKKTYSLTVRIIELDSQVQKIKNLRKDVSDIITTIQTRIGVLKEERRESGLS